MKIGAWAGYPILGPGGEVLGSVTAAYATFRVTPGGMTGRLCCAGHPPALIRRADGRVHRIDSRGPLLGFFPEIQLADVRFRLVPGDTLLLYTRRRD